MKKIEKSIDKVFLTVQKMNGKSSDIKTRKMIQDQCQIGILFLQSVSSDDKISDILIHSIMAVSYTHLDVYKRQVFHHFFIF